ncbi:MAG: hypothetical protein ACOCQ1_02080 [Halanaerobiaceae bacterium]
MKMNKKKIKKEDGRNLIFYTFTDEKENNSQKQSKKEGEENV